MSTSKHANDPMRKRINQRTERGMGSLYASPKKSRATRGNIVAPKNMASAWKQNQLHEQLDELMAPESDNESSDSFMDVDEDPDMGSGIGDFVDPIPDPSPSGTSTPSAFPAAGRVYVPEPAPPSDITAESALAEKRKQKAPTEEAKSLYNRWEDLLPQIEDPYLRYMETWVGKISLPVLPPSVRVCSAECKEIHKTSTLLCLYSHHYQYVTFEWCSSSPLAICLIRNGLFPTAPTKPSISISIELLAFYKALFEHACDATTALAHALNTHYTRRGFVLVDKKGSLVGEPFRRGLGNAFQWYDCLLHKIEQRVETAVRSAANLWNPPASDSGGLGGADSGGKDADSGGKDTAGMCSDDADGNGAEGSPAESDGMENKPKKSRKGKRKKAKPVEDAAPYPAATLKECAEILQSRCPACFGGNSFGKPFKSGGDIVVAVDGCFNHRHVASQGNGPAFYDPLYFLTKQYVDGVGKKIDVDRSRPPRARKNGSKMAPDHVVDVCEASHEAGSGSNVKTALDRFDDGGIMGLVCRHDIPLIMANIDTPGEQQKYAVSMILHLFSLIPKNATVTVLYDVGCVLDRSRNRYDIFPDAISIRLAFAISAMHAYAHEFACQIINNPRYRVGLGLSDGEGTERLWSRLKGLIGILRMVLRNKRLFLIDRHLKALGVEMRGELGNTLRDRMEKNVWKHKLAAETTLAQCATTVDKLREEWQTQKDAQVSVRAHPQSRIKKELDSVFKLQSELDAVEKSLNSTRNQVESWHGGSQISEAILDNLEKQQNEIMAQVEELYTSLNVDESFPELSGIDLVFVRKLLILRDLKINIRKRAVASFYEWDKIHQAQGGKGPPMGTKLHQYARRAIAKRTPALVRTIQKFNKLCGECKALYRPEWEIPLPDALPTDLHKLQHESSILEDVWISPASQEGNAWLYDSDIRDAMRAVQRKDRSEEEVKRLGMEYDNLCRWFGKELKSVEVALVDPNNELLHGPLTMYREKLLSYIPHWQTTSTKASYQNHVASAADLARAISSRLFGNVIQGSPVQYQWTQVVLDPSGPQGDPFGGDPEDLGVLGSEEHFEGLGSLETPGNPIAVQVQDFTVNNMELIEQDSDLLSRIAFNARPAAHEGNTTAARILTIGTPGSQKQIRHLFEEDDLQIIQQQGARLNDVCMNGCAAILYQQALLVPSKSASETVVLSSYHLVFAKYNPGNLWKHVGLTSYWTKSTWIIPIHRIYPVGHWVCVVVHLESSEIHLFDSFNQRKGWTSTLKDVVAFVDLLRDLASEKGQQMHAPQLPWKFLSLTNRTLQTTNHSCGLWVLATIASQLGGFQAPDIDEDGILKLRQQLFRHVLNLPLKYQ